jgi:hypothetical protein
MIDRASHNQMTLETPEQWPAAARKQTLLKQNI